MSNSDTFPRLEYCFDLYELIHTLLNTGGGHADLWNLLLLLFFFFFFLGSSLFSLLVLTLVYSTKLLGLPGGSVVKNEPADVGDTRDVVGSLVAEDPLEKEMATHPKILAWRISWAEESSRLQSVGSQRVGHN